MAFDIAGNDLLGADANALDNNVLGAHTRLAARLLDLADHEDAIEEDAEHLQMAEDALALQVNLQIERGVSAKAYERERVDGLERYYRKERIDPDALDLAHVVLTEIGKLGSSQPSFPVVRSRR